MPKRDEIIKPALTEPEKSFVNLVLKGMSIDKAAHEAGFTKVPGNKLMHRPVVMDAIINNFGRLGVKWQKLTGDMKKCLEDVINRQDTGKKASDGVRVQACKLVILALSNINPALLLDAEEEIGKEAAAQEILGKLDLSGVN